MKRERYPEIRSCPIPDGYWEIHSGSLRLPREDLLHLWLSLHAWKQENHGDITCTRVRIDPDAGRSEFRIHDDTLRITLNRPDLHDLYRKEKLDCPEFPHHPAFSGNRICMVVPALQGDSRWESIPMTASSLFLGSALSRQGYSVQVIHPRLSDSSTVAEKLPDMDLMGLTLFEDLLPEINSWLKSIAEQLPQWIAVGGPMVTLNPLAAVTHLPMGRIWVRGEGEYVFPSILKALKAPEPSSVSSFSGLLVIDGNGLIASSFEQVNRPDPLTVDDFDFSFVRPSQWQQGLELNVSRGCGRSCVFCSRVQGRVSRKFSLISLKQMLTRINEAMNNTFVPSLPRVININDDDILQDVNYASRVFTHVKEAGFRLWGIQTSISSLFAGDDIDEKILVLLSDRELFVDAPLVWLGTDTFSVSRGKRLGKFVPDEEKMDRLLHAFQTHGIHNYHYWIISDYASGWPELSREIQRICRWWRTYSLFQILPHSPFLVPYPSTALYRLLYRTGRSGQIRFKHRFHSRHACLEYVLVDRVESPWEMLNRMLLTPATEMGDSFLETLKERNPERVMLTAFRFLRQERMRLTGVADDLEPLIQAETILNNLLEKELSH